MGGEPSGRQVLGTSRCTIGAGHRYTFLRPSRLCDGPFCLFTFFFVLHCCHQRYTVEGLLECPTVTCAGGM